MEQRWAELKEEQSHGGEAKVGVEGVAETREALPGGGFGVLVHRDRVFSSSSCQSSSPRGEVLKQQFTAHSTNRNSRFLAQHNCIRSEACIMGCLTAP